MMRAGTITVLSALLISMAGMQSRAQNLRSITGNIATNKTETAIYEELQPAVLIDGKLKEKKLVGKGSRFLGQLVMSPGSIGKELGSIVRTKRKFVLKDIKFTVAHNYIDSCRAEIRIYEMTDDKVGATILKMPICQDIPVSHDKAEHSIYPEEQITLEPGKYFISFVMTDCSSELKEKWTDEESWSPKEYQQNCIYRLGFPTYLKKSYKRNGPDSPLEDFFANIGLTVEGLEYR